MDFAIIMEGQISFSVNLFLPERSDSAYPVVENCVTGEALVLPWGSY
jgi:hypothetical protein